MLKVLHIGVGNMYGGIESHLVCLARSRALCPGMGTNFAISFAGRLDQDLRASGSSVHVLGAMHASRPWTVWRAQRKLRELVETERFNVVICHGPWSYALLAPAIRKTGTRLFLWAHAGMTGKHWIERRARRVKPDGIIANSRFSAAGMSELFPGVRTEVVHCAVEPPQVDLSKEAVSEIRTRLNTPLDHVVILQASRIEELKGQRILLSALAQLKDVPNWAAWIAGGPQTPKEKDYFDELKSQAAELNLGNRVQFLGQRNDVPQLMASANIFCQPNLQPDSFGIVFIEALYAGKPVVTSAIGGPLEFLDDSCGVLLPPGDPAALAKALKRLILDEASRRNVQKDARMRARALCDPQHILENLKRVLEAA